MKQLNSRLMRNDISDRPTIGLLWAYNCHLSLHTCYQSIACLLHRGCGPHTRCTDTAKQKTVAYLSGRGRQRRQMFLPRALITLVMPLHWPGSANAATSVCLYREQEHWDFGQSSGCIRWRAWGLPYPASGGWSAIAPPFALHVFVLTGTPWRQRPIHCPPFSAPILLRHRLIVQQRPTWRQGNSPACRPGTDQPLRFLGRAPSVAPPPAVLRRFGCATARYVDRSMGSQYGPGTASRAGRRLPPFTPTLVIQLRSCR